MDSYKEFSYYYDLLTCDVDYKGYTEYLLKLFKRFDRMPTLLLDLACGTGNISFPFAQKGVSVIGVDSSSAMLSVAMNKKNQNNLDVMFICQNAQELDLYGTVDGAVCCLDSLNHIVDYNDFKKVIKNVALFLEKERLFIFDVNTNYKHKEVLANNTFVKEVGSVYCVWQNTYCEKQSKTEIALDIFEQQDDKYLRFTENFCERAYSPEQIDRALQEAGLKIEAIFAENTTIAPKPNTERVVYVTRRV